MLAEKSFSHEQNDELNRKLNAIVKLHNDKIDLCKLTSRTFVPIAILHFISSSIVICVCCLMLFLADGASKTVYQFYLMVGLSDAFIYTFGGTLLMEASTAIKHAAYDFQWYKCDMRNQKIILMIMMRAHKRTAIDIPFFDASLETFVRIIQTAGSYATLLNTFL